MTRRPHPSRIPCARAVAAAALLGLLAACANDSAPVASSDREDLLRNNLSVAAAALAAGQAEAARRLYLSLAERFDEAPEPALGLGYVALRSNDLTAGERYFVRAAELADDAPALKAEALLGAGRTALARGEAGSARRYFENAEGLGPVPALGGWIANGIAVSATLDADHRTAEASYTKALRLSSGHPRITANLVRMLVAAGRVDDAARIYGQQESSYWPEGEERSLSRLIERARKERRERVSSVPLRPGLALRLPEPGGVAPPAGKIELPASSGLALRLSDLTAEAAVEAPFGEPVASPPRKPDRSPSAALPTALTLLMGQGRRLEFDGDAVSVLVAEPGVADVQLLSPGVLYVIGKKVGRTSVAVLGEAGRVQDWILSVVLDLEPLRAVLAEEPGLPTVRARRVALGVALSGEVGSVALSERAARLAAAALPKDTPVENELRIAGAQQVNLEVQIAEVQRSVTEDLGINWEAFRRSGENLFGFRFGRLAAEGLGSAVAIGDFPPTIVDGQVSPGLFFGRQTANTRIAGMIDALSRAGLANVLARPNVTAVSGERASFFSGGEYPLPTGFEDGVIVFEYKKYGILLDFVPTVIDTGRIVLNVRPEVSEPSLNQSVQIVGVSIPVINVRRAETTVEVGNGESIVIAGLFRNTSNTREAGLPFLKDVPVFGPLFGHRSIRSEELELIVIVTAKLVRAGTAPDDDKAPPPRRVRGYFY